MNRIVSVRDVHKTFKIPNENSSGLKQQLINLLKGRKGYHLFSPLRGVSFDIEEGDFFGIVGRNGSGKSTLLKTIAGIYYPNKGTVSINGSLVPFIELGVGFNPELTGRENIFLNGALLGFSHSEMKNKYDDIVAFAELGDFMEERLKNYSSGMQVRLAFSIAIQAKGDILLLDEVLAVGDSAFQKKCFDYFEELKKEKRTIILVTHDMSAVRRFCNKAILIEDGKIKCKGSPDEVASQYILDNLNEDKSVNDTKNISFSKYIKSLDVKSISSLNPKNDGNFLFEISYELNENIEVDLGIALIYNGQSIMEKNTQDINIGHEKNRKYKIRYDVPLIGFNPNKLQVDVAIFKKEDFSLIGFRTNALNFEIMSGPVVKGGLLDPVGGWVLGDE